MTICNMSQDVMV